MESPTVRDFVTDAMRYWEPRRIVYNVVLAAIVLTYFALGWPASRHTLEVNLVLLVFVLAVLANVAYCAAYIPDVVAQASGFRDLWQKYRWVLFLIGVAFAGVITRFWALAFFGADRH